MHKVLDTILLMIGTIISIIMLLGFINFQIGPVILIIAIGIISFIFDSILEKEFASSFRLINMISNRAHKNVKKFWNLAKGIMFILIYEMIGVDIISLFINTDGIEEKKMLYSAAIFAGGIAAIASMVSYRIKQIYGDKYVKHRSLLHNFSIKIPNYWQTVDLDDTERAVKAFNDELQDKACYIFKEERSTFDDSATLDDFAKLQIEMLYSNR